MRVVNLTMEMTLNRAKWERKKNSRSQPKFWAKDLVDVE